MAKNKKPNKPGKAVSMRRKWEMTQNFQFHGKADHKVYEDEDNSDEEDEEQD